MILLLFPCHFMGGIVYKYGKFCTLKHFNDVLATMQYQKQEKQTFYKLTDWSWDLKEGRLFWTIIDKPVANSSKETSKLE